MATIQTDVLILGGGLTGLTLHYLLRESSLKVLLVEGRPRLGGRILTQRATGAPPMEMGATWMGSQHTHLAHLLRKLQIETFPQELGQKAFYEWISTSPPQLVDLPPNEAPSYRIRGGTDTLIAALAEAQDPATRFLGERVETISPRASGLHVSCTTNAYQARMVVSTLPPNLLLKTVQVAPGLPADLLEIMGKTHTWMGESVKFGLSSQELFWNEPACSGTVFSNVGPISEMYDHCNYERDAFAIIGFLGNSYAALEPGDRAALVLQQLRKYYGTRVTHFRDYREVVWAREPFTYASYGAPVLPHQNNGHPAYLQPYLDGKLVLAGSETAQEFPGYMEGAVRSAEVAFDCVQGALKG